MNESSVIPRHHSVSPARSTEGFGERNWHFINPHNATQFARRLSKAEHNLVYAVLGERKEGYFEWLGLTPTAVHSHEKLAWSDLRLDWKTVAVLWPRGLHGFAGVEANTCDWEFANWLWKIYGPQIIVGVITLDGVLRLTGLAAFNVYLDSDEVATCKADANEKVFEFRSLSWRGTVLDG